MHQLTHGEKDEGHSWVQGEAAFYKYSPVHCLQPDYQWGGEKPERQTTGITSAEIV